MATQLQPNETWFAVTGNVGTASFPTVLSGSGTAVTTTYTSSAWGAQDSFVLKKIIAIIVPAAGDSLTLHDKAGTQFFPTITVATTFIAGSAIDFGSGIQCPAGGIGFKTTGLGAGSYLFLGERQKSVQ